MLRESAIGLVFDRHTLRRLRYSFGRSPKSFAVETDPDPETVAIVAEPFDDVEDVQDRLGRLESHLLDRDDRRAVFLTVYTEMTAETTAAIDAGEFNDPVWMRRYLVCFAEYYRRAFLAFERGSMATVPDPWLVAFGTAHRGDALILQDAFLGINAHILYDLALTVSDVGTRPDRGRKYADHRRIDGVLARLVAVQRELLADTYAPGLSRIGTELGGRDERWSAEALERAREFAWRTAIVRTDWSSPLLDAGVERLLSRTGTGGAYSLLTPLSSPEAMAALRRIEADEFELSSYAIDFHNQVRASSTRR